MGGRHDILARYHGGSTGNGQFGLRDRLDHQWLGRARHHYCRLGSRHLAAPPKNAIAAKRHHAATQAVVVFLRNDVVPHVVLCSERQYPLKRSFATPNFCNKICHKRTHAPQQTACLFDILSAAAKAPTMATTMLPATR